MPLVQETLAGFNCTVFAYGQTGTGKTHTMEGDINNEENAGIVPRSVKAILEQLEQSGVEFTIRVSFLELYNEELQDLLTPPNSDKKLKLCEVEKKGVVCQNLEEITVLSVKDIFDILQRGILRRQTAATLCNKNSSRSHSIFTMKIMIKECNVDGEEVVRHGQLNLVDLAGSECVGRSGAQNDRAREAGSINQSLLTLGRVITALVDHHGHIPYRDSKLTRLLQESLGGKAKTCIIATVTPSQNAVEETLSTLDYAHRAKNIKNMPQVNQRMTKKTVMKEYCEEIESLRSQLQANRDKNGVFVLPDVFYGMETKIASQEAQIAEVESVLKSKMEEVKTMKAEKDEAEERVGIVQKELDHTSSELKRSSATLQQAVVELEDKNAQLEASNAVICEQESTEGTLLGCGTELQNEVKAQRSDRKHLFHKIEKLIGSNATRDVYANSFVATMVTSAASLQKGVSGLLSSNEAEAAKICDGVDEMLSRGCETCAALNTCIDQAVRELIHKAESNTTVSSSLNEIKTHLASTNADVASSLQTMQQQISAWLVEVQSSMQITRTLLDQQNQCAAAMKEAMEQHAIQIVDMSESFITQQSSMARQSEITAQDLKTLITSTLSAQQQQMEESAAVMAQTMSSKVNAMQTAMTTMLEDIMSTSQQSMQMMAQASAKTGKESQIALEMKVTEMVVENTAAADLAKKSIGDMTGVTRSMCASNEKDVTNLNTLFNDVETRVNGLNAAIGGKKTDLDSTIASVVSFTHKSLAHATETVGNTSQKVSSLIADIKGDANSMMQTSSESISTFTTFINNQGQTVCSKVGEHFTELSNYLQTTSEVIGRVQEQTHAFNTNMQECVVAVTGATPTKKVLSDNQTVLGKLQPTREHTAIRNESLAGIWRARVRFQSNEMVQDNEIDAEAEAAVLNGDEEIADGEIQLKVESNTQGEKVDETSTSGQKRAESPVATENTENLPPNKVQRTSTSSNKEALASKSGIARRSTRTVQ